MERRQNLADTPSDPGFSPKHTKFAPFAESKNPKFAAESSEDDALYLESLLQKPQIGLSQPTFEGDPSLKPIARSTSITVQFDASEIVGEEREEIIRAIPNQENGI